MVGIIDKKTSIFVLTVVILLFHLARNISILYFAAQGLLLLLSFAGCNKSTNIAIAKIIGGIIVIWIYAVSMSLFYSNWYGDPFLGIARLTYITPYIILFFLFRRSQGQSIFIWKVLVFFVAIAALTIPYQMIYGSIAWFAEPGERAGVIRYSSLVGSLTSFGGVVGAAFVASFILFKHSTKFLFAIIFVICSVLSLQKASIGALLIALALLYWLGYFRFSWSLILGFLLVVLFVFTVFAEDESIRDSSLLFLKGVVGFEDDSAATDVTLVQSMVDRFTELPRESLEFFGFNSILLGVGVFGASGGLGYPDYPMMHNLIGEILIMLGIPFSVVIIIFLLRYVKISLSICRNSATNNDTARLVAACVFVMTLVVSIFTGALFYHPVIGAFFWFSLSELVHYNTGNRRYSIKSKSLRGVINV